jgi:hypothetical protein
MSKFENGHADHFGEGPKEARLDEELEETFPASDPPSIVQPAPPERQDDTHHVRRNPVWQDRLAGLMILAGVLLFAGVIRR